ncbi:MAG: RNA polymerase sigma factor [bacterium]|nr:RNA polymerase sigma factor [bacterium]
MVDTRDRSTDRQEVAGPGPEHTEDGFERFYAETSRRLWGYLRRLTGDPSVADDVLQESYLRYLGRPSPVTDDRGRSAYLFRIATNLVHDRWRSARRERNWLDQLLHPRPDGKSTGLAWRWPSAVDAGSPSAASKLDVELVFGQLKSRERSLLWLAYVEGYRHREIAAILDLKPASIKVLLSRARKRLATLLARHGLGPEPAGVHAVETST